MRKHRLALSMGFSAVFVASFLPLVSPVSIASEGTVESNLAEELDRLAVADLPVRLNFREVEIDKLLQELAAAAAPLELEIVEPFHRPRITIQAGNMSLRDALIRLRFQAGLQYEVVNEHKVRVRSTALMAGMDGVTNPRLIPAFKVEPAYPAELRSQGIEGQVILQAIINESGFVKQLQVLKATPPGHPQLAEAAMEAIEQWLYEPATLDGEPVSVYLTIVIDFKLDRESSSRISTSTTEREPQEITVFLTADGIIKLGDREFGHDELTARLHEALEQAERKLVVLRVDPSTTHSELVPIMDLIRDAGAEGLVIPRNDLAE